MNAEEIKALRYRLGLSQTDFAEKVGANQSSVSRWETGEDKPVGTAIKVMQMLENQPRLFGEDAPVYNAGK
jgi:putative transcriptional regulator